jgi:probable phosphoglycerate mutase
MPLMLYLLRHGETAASMAGGFCGTLDPELTAEGQQMAQDFAASYRGVPWTAIYCSPLRRAVATGEPLFQALSVTPHLEDGLREIAYGRWEGMAPEEVNDAFHDDYIRWLADPGWNAPTGGQRAVDVAWRAVAVLNAIEQSHVSGNVLIISHKATLRIMLCSLLGIDLGRYRDRIATPVASLSIVEMAPHGPLLHRLGDRSHLRESLRNRPGT